MTRARPARSPLPALGRLLGLVLGPAAVAGCTVPTGEDWLPAAEPVPFQVVASTPPTSPAAGAPPQPLNPTLQLRFSDYPDPATLTYPTVQLGPRGGAIQYTSQLSLVDKALTLRPRDHLLPVTDYFLSVDDGLRSLAAEPLAPFALRFHTGTTLDPTPPLVPPVTLDQLLVAGGPLRTSCAVGGCHTSAGGNQPVRGIDFAADPATVRAQLLGHVRSGIDALLLVEPGRPERSYLLRKLLARSQGGFLRIEGEPMPPAASGQPAVDLATLHAIESWIAAGAN